MDYSIRIHTHTHTHTLQTDTHAHKHNTHTHTWYQKSLCSGFGALLRRGRMKNSENLSEKFWKIVWEILEFLGNCLRTSRNSAKLSEIFSKFVWKFLKICPQQPQRSEAPCQAEPAGRNCFDFQFWNLFLRCCEGPSLVKQNSQVREIVFFFWKNWSFFLECCEATCQVEPAGREKEEEEEEEAGREFFHSRFGLIKCR